MCDGEGKKGLQTQRNAILTPYGPPRARISHPGYLCRVGSDWNRDVSEGGGTPHLVRVRIPLGRFGTEVKRQRDHWGVAAGSNRRVTASGLHSQNTEQTLQG